MRLEGCNAVKPTSCLVYKIDPRICCSFRCHPMVFRKACRSGPLHRAVRSFLLKFRLRLCCPPQKPHRSVSRRISGFCEEKRFIEFRYLQCFRIFPCTIARLSPATAAMHWYTEKLDLCKVRFQDFQVVLSTVPRSRDASWYLLISIACL